MRIWDRSGTAILFSTEQSDMGRQAEVTPERHESIQTDELHYSFVDAGSYDERSRFNRLLEVHLPVHLDGRESEKSTEARAFGKWLGEVTGVPVDFFDERFTSAEAEQALESAKLTKKRRKARLDMLAAQGMLAAYLESDGKGQEDPGAIDD